MAIRRLAQILGLCGVAAFGLISIIASSPMPQPNNPPAAPTMLSLDVPSNAFGSSFSGVTPAVRATATAPANYFELPLITNTAPIIRVLVATPYPSELAIAATDVTRGTNVTIPRIQSGTQMPSTGGFQVVSVTPNGNWTVVIRYPNSFQGSMLITTAISDVVQGVSSAPLDFSLSFRGSTVTVSIVTANNDGKVTSTPAGINCPGTCSATFLGTSSVILTQSVLHNQTEFTGWSGSCTGMGNNCTVQLMAPGAAIIPVNPVVTANFRIHTNSSIPPLTPQCPMPMVTGMRWVEPPNCGSPPPLGATLQCDMQGFFCCGASGGTPTPRCPGGNETAVTCAKDSLGVTPSNETLIQPGGCYETTK